MCYVSCFSCCFVLNLYHFFLLCVLCCVGNRRKSTTVILNRKIYQMNSTPNFSNDNQSKDELDILLRKLRPFQREGFEFATRRRENGTRNDVGRILLADEMVSNVAMFEMDIYTFLFTSTLADFLVVLMILLFFIIIIFYERDWGKCTSYFWPCDV